MSKFIKFSWLPGSWGLRGKSRAIAEAEYLYNGYDLDVALAKIDAKFDDTYPLNERLIAIELKYNKIDQYEADRRLARLALPEPTDEKIIASAMLAIDLKHGKISQQEYERKNADILEEPFMAMPKISWDPVDPSKTYFELDYNEHFVTYLQENGYVGAEDDVINKWLNDVCYSILDDMAQTEPDFVRTVKSVRRPDGKTEHH